MNRPKNSYPIEARIDRRNPFTEVDPKDDATADEELVSSALAGNKDSLEQLVRRHQPWVFNICMRMVWRRDLAEDATQEILIKVVTKLSTFRGQSKFRTWLYRIAFNHLLNVRKTEFEDPSVTFTDMGRALDETPDLELPDPRSVPVELPLLVEEARVGCMTAMLMCLDRRQRMAFILGEYFGATSDVGGEVMDVSPDNFRQLLSRARRDLYQFMNDKCGLVNAANPCRCAKKTRSYIQAGYVDPDRLEFTKGRLATINEIAPHRLNELQELDRKHAELFRDHGFLAPPDLAAKLRELISRSGFDAESAAASS
ncbi:MAG TPA: RNA polymerase sigma factor [Chthoniobacterales bacterium]|jgi:RNA polymerase sigma factor (sigma-70 family)|nr:RNA polymerase sigma factor [Chthoniobacterales bacterium]